MEHEKTNLNENLDHLQISHEILNYSINKHEAKQKLPVGLLFKSAIVTLDCLLQLLEHI